MQKFEEHIAKQASDNLRVWLAILKALSNKDLSVRMPMGLLDSLALMPSTFQADQQLWLMINTIEREVIKRFLLSALS